MKRSLQLFGILAAAMLAAGCADTLGPEYKEVSEADSGLQFYGPGLEGGHRRFLMGHDQHYVKRTSGVYGPRGGDYPQAVLILMEMPPRRHFTRVAEVGEGLEDWGRFKNKKLTRGKPGIAVNKIGRADFLPVIADGVACIVWRQLWGPVYAQGQGTELLDGYYCKGPGPMMTHAEGQAIVELVGHVKYGPLEPPAEWRVTTEASTLAESAKAHYREREYDKAIEKLTEALEIDPDNPAFHYERGRAWDRKDETGRALEDFKEAIRLKPDYMLAHDRAGAVYAKRKEFTSALTHHNRAIELAPDEARLYNNRCWTYGLMKRAAEALTDCNESLRLKPDVVATLDSRALAYWLMGDMENASKDLERAREINSQYPSPEQRLKEFEELF